jgi:hypothetical protein
MAKRNRVPASSTASECRESGRFEDVVVYYGIAVPTMDAGRGLAAQTIVVLQRQFNNPAICNSVPESNGQWWQWAMDTGRGGALTQLRLHRYSRMRAVRHPSPDFPSRVTRPFRSPPVPVDDQAWEGSE